MTANIEHPGLGTQFRYPREGLFFTPAYAEGEP